MRQNGTTGAWGREYSRRRVPRSKRERTLAVTFVLALSLLVPLSSGCSPQGTQAQAQAQAQVVADASPALTSLPAATARAAKASETSTPASGISNPLASPAAASTAAITATGVASPTGVQPTPTGAPPANPLDVLDIFSYFPGEFSLVKSDVVDLDGKAPGNVLYTVTLPRFSITTESTSAIGVVTYDAVYRKWNATWTSLPISGTASPLPAVGQEQLGGFNGKDLLRTGRPVLAARTTTLDGRAHLYLWGWDKVKHTASMLKMLPAGSTTERNAIFDADLDVNLVDLNDDGVYEVVADNISGVQAWRWDGSRFVPQEVR